VALCTVTALMLALHAMPLAGGARVIYALAVALNVGLLALSSWSGILGMAVSLWQRTGRGAGGPVLLPATGQARTAVLLPVYDEDPVRVFAAAGVMADSIARQRVGTADFWVLSDTRSATGAAAEEAAYGRLLAGRKPDSGAIHYRRRVDNTGRKAGNIAEFCARWGAEYDFMVVLDADSLMTGGAIGRLVGAMEANPNAGLIQTMCYPVGRSTLFARMQQFGARLYGPMLARGVAFWQGPRGSYWGHNAILRTAAFTAHCGLPVLPGAAPLGGEILCHDTVEAALMLRAGWDVWMLPDGPEGSHEGSWEETPTNLLDHLQRDRRWCQGNLQHGAVLRAEGLKAASFIHLGQGILHYLSGPMFVAFVLLSALAGPHASPAADRAMLAMVLTLLFAPRVLALGATLLDGATSASFGGRGRLLASALLDQVFGFLVGPVMLVFYSIFVSTTLTGRVVRWDAQARDDRGLGWAEVGGQIGIPLAVAAIATLALAAVSPVAAAWLAPGLLLGVPVAVWTSRQGVGEWARRHRLFATPEEMQPPAALLALATAETTLRTATTVAEMPLLPDGSGMSVVVQTLRRRTSRLTRRVSEPSFS
jgi:membrane glycosyltransferase